MRNSEDSKIHGFEEKDSESKVAKSAKEMTKFVLFERKKLDHEFEFDV